MAGPSGATPRLALPYPVPADNVDVPRDVQALATKLETIKSLGVPVVTALPGAPNDGDEIYFQSAALAAAGLIWHLRYNSASASAYKWECLGGAPLAARADADRGITSTAYVAMPTDPQTITVPLAGDYDIRCEAQIWHAVLSQIQNSYYGYTVGATAPADVWAATAGMTTVSAGVTKTTRQTIPGPTFTVIERVRSDNAASAHFSLRRLWAWPVRVG